MVDTPRKTFPELQALSAPVVDTDVLAVYRTPGPAKRTTASVLGSYVNTVIGTAFTRTLLATANNNAFLTALGQIASSFVDFIQSGTGALTRTGQAKLRDVVSVKDFGAVGDGVTDDTSAINAALLAHRRVTVPAGTYVITTINMSVAGTSLILEDGAILAPTTYNIKAVNVTAADCSLIGGKISSPATFDGSNSQRTYATVWVTGDNFSMFRVWLFNIPRAGVHFEACTNHRVEGCRFQGNYPYASYNPATTTAQIAIDYDPPTDSGPTTDSGNGAVVVIGNRIETCIQGVLTGNYGGTASQLGIVITGNSFNRCWTS